MLRTFADAHGPEDRTLALRAPRRSGIVRLLGMVLVLVMAGCQTSNEGADQGAGIVGGDTVEGDPVDGDTLATDGGADAATPCDPDVVGSDFGLTVVIYRVDSGQLGLPCFGQPIAVVEESWLALSEMTPPEQLGSLEMFAGFASRADNDTVAFAAPLPVVGGGVDELGDGFVIAVDLAASEDDDEELLVTMAHEISHVFTQGPDQLDRSVEPADCETYDNGLGCFTEGAFMTAWIEAFWSEDDLLSLPADGSTDEVGGEERCALDAAFIGSYGASHPEEDFAESFAAYVLDIDVRPEVQARVDFFEQFPELVAFRDRAAAADLTQLSYQFEPCG